MGCLRVIAFVVVGVLGLLIASALFAPGGRFGPPYNYADDARAFCAVGVGRLASAYPGLSAGVMAETYPEGEDATFACGATFAGALAIVHVRGVCHSPMECARPVALWRSDGELVWIADGEDAGALPGARSRPQQQARPAAQRTAPARSESNAAAPSAPAAPPDLSTYVVIETGRPLLTAAGAASARLTARNTGEASIIAVVRCAFHADGAAINAPNTATLRLAPRGSDAAALIAPRDTLPEKPPADLTVECALASAKPGGS